MLGRIDGNQRMRVYRVSQYLVLLEPLSEFCEDMFRIRMTLSGLDPFESFVDSCLEVTFGVRSDSEDYTVYTSRK